mmetsp:Transcript_34257/g.83227  ORF Transcript_34257/g.83227 Transcript_34257/m.83227 type:complete len:83 (+) Transcript_34257:40-288(+)
MVQALRYYACVQAHRRRARAWYTSPDGSRKHPFPCWTTLDSLNAHQIMVLGTEKVIPHGARDDSHGSVPDLSQLAASFGVIR